VASKSCCSPSGVSDPDRSKAQKIEPGNLGHKIAHAIAKHGNERMSQGLLAQLGAIGFSAPFQVTSLRQVRSLRRLTGYEPMWGFYSPTVGFKNQKRIILTLS